MNGQEVDDHHNCEWDKECSRGAINNEVLEVLSPNKACVVWVEDGFGVEETFDWDGDSNS